MLHELRLIKAVEVLFILPKRLENEWLYQITFTWIKLTWNVMSLNLKTHFSHRFIVVMNTKHGSVAKHNVSMNHCWPVLKSSDPLL